MAYKQKGFSNSLRKIGVSKVIGVLFLVVAVAAGIVLATSPETLTFFTGAARAPLTFGQAVKLTEDGQGFKVSGATKQNIDNFTIEGWVKLNATPPVGRPEVIFKLGGPSGEAAAGKGSVVVYAAPVNAVNTPPNPPIVPRKGTLVVAVNTKPSLGEPRGGFRLFDAGPITTERDSRGDFIFGDGIFDQQWHHIALTVSTSRTNQNRWSSPTVISFFIDGKLAIPGVFHNSKPVGSWVVGEIDFGPSVNDLYVGADVFGSPQKVVSFQGQIDEVRYSKRVRYTKDFTPTNRPFKADGQTLTIMHLDGSIVPAPNTDGSVNVSGSPSFAESFQ